MEQADFANAINAAPDDFNLRLVYADWLEERGDANAAGWRWSAEHRRIPRSSHRLFQWLVDVHADQNRPEFLPQRLLDCFQYEGFYYSRSEQTVSFYSAYHALNALAAAVECYLPGMILHGDVVFIPDPSNREFRRAVGHLTMNVHPDWDALSIPDLMEPNPFLREEPAIARVREIRLQRHVHGWIGMPADVERLIELGHVEPL